MVRSSVRAMLPCQTGRDNTIWWASQAGDRHAADDNHRLPGDARGSRARDRIAQRRGSPQALWPRRRDVRRYPRSARARARGQDTRRLLLYAWNDRILDRPGEPLSQADLRRRQEVRILLRRRLAVPAGGADRAADGFEAGRTSQGRFFRLE